MAVLQDVDLVPLVQAAEATPDQDDNEDEDEAEVDAEGEISACTTGSTTFQLDLAPMVNSWSRAARRARAQARAHPAPVEQDQPANGAAEPSLADKPATATATEPLPEPEPLFRARLVIDTPTDGADGADADGPQVLGARVTLEWTWGRDRTLVDAFWKFVLAKGGLVKRPRAGEGEGEGDDGDEGTQGAEKRERPLGVVDGGPARGGHGHGRGGQRGRRGGRGPGRGRGRGRDAGW